MRSLQVRNSEILKECESWKNQFKTIEKNQDEYETYRRNYEQLKSKVWDLE